MVDYRDFLRHSKPTPRAESQRKYEAGWDRVFKQRKSERDTQATEAYESFKRVYKEGPR